MHEITGDIIKHCYSKASYVVLMSFWIFFTYKSVNAAKNSATEGLVCSWTIQVLPYYHLAAVRGKMKELSGILLLLASVAVLQSLMLYWTTDFPSLKSLVSFLLFFFLCEKIILNYYKETCTDFKSNSQVGVLTKKWKACPNELNYRSLEWRKRKQVKLCSAGQHLNCRCRSSPGINQLQWSQIDLYLLRIWDSIIINSRSMLILERKREKYFNVYNLFWALWMLFKVWATVMGASPMKISGQ